MGVSKRIKLALVVGAVGVGLASPAVALSSAEDDRERGLEIVEMGDARLKFEVNETDGDGGVQAFIDADAWIAMSIFDPGGRQIFTSRMGGRMAEQGGTELFLESAEPPFGDLPLDQLLARWPEGEYRFRGRGLNGEVYVGAAQLTHDLPDGPTLVSPVEGDGPQDPDATRVEWEPVDDPNGSPIIGYQVIIVQPDTGLTGLPTITLDVMMPPEATSLAVPPGLPGGRHRIRVGGARRRGEWQPDPVIVLLQHERLTHLHGPSFEPAPRRAWCERRAMTSAPLVT